MKVGEGASHDGSIARTAASLLKGTQSHEGVGEYVLHFKAKVAQHRL